MSDQSLRDHALPPSENLAPRRLAHGSSGDALDKVPRRLPHPWRRRQPSAGVAAIPLAAITRHAATLASAARAPGCSAAWGGRASSIAPSDAAVAASPEGHASTAAAAASASPANPPSALRASSSRDEACTAAATTSTLPAAATSRIHPTSAPPPPSSVNTAPTAFVASAPATRSGRVDASPSNDASRSATGAST
jgi:hypothetical protein